MRKQMRLRKNIMSEQMMYKTNWSRRGLVMGCYISAVTTAAVTNIQMDHNLTSREAHLT